jgi:hypothetical protein
MGKNGIHLCAIWLVMACVLPAHAQEERRWTFSGRVSGSTNSGNSVLKLDPSIGFMFNKHFQTYAGVPVYFVHGSATGSMNGIGNAYVGLQANVDTETFDYTSYVDVTAPTGDKDRGFSTGRVTADWTNRVSRRFSSITPFASAGIANTISDTSFFTRPFSSLGLISHFDGGATFDLSDVLYAGGSVYAVRASGEQRIISKVIKRDRAGSPTDGGQGRGRNRVFETQAEAIVPAEIANDHGVSAWFGIRPRSAWNFYAGYNRSVNYDFNSLFFGIGFRID